jgi:transcriptional regulator
MLRPRASIGAQGGRLHPSGIFHQPASPALERFVAENAFGVIFAPGPSRLVAAHAPVLMSQGKRLRFHLSTANPLCTAMVENGWALAVITGLHGYISPDWYGAADQVPTWNYLSAEIEGPVRPMGQEETVILLDDLAAHFEAALEPKPSWTRAKMATARFEALLSAITGFEMRVDRFEGVKKLSQNKSADQIERAAAELALRPGTEAAPLAALMREAIVSATE